ncbi:MAG: 30S ribosomal protein S14 type Z [Candidatus Uhrbacteria bacterium GW2011_GWD2_41_121]|uniref:Small ribosomal subunit protein uS14 n=1 Tax=Candidatus Uhrbacteria bacterium GW2011_GWC1_41_20 TaxID=1618983 RepID=A0A0G0VET7_9BACT|nr:MAG: 30S ribosomal protein S14 type Z [Candidatus Uhrbacteria bacterium GW2011_GWE1_39_46]KKR64089.1 MAG: 30S ribosomal protein S14 type Z [Candidatus Uhrbacteria bacterium GW2011_GWC2_40_450]KKR90014.1 MAG: 30S ribosomal protein S14 type Z [Candidatus Uhrbacteria bacterium GW2011_GWD2_41_121]KKR90647.1 MAG: 30S ribosomal protein S14 type Z [Candidatus Uhrbacteria bacterium GW2011_GWE2_41_1153]KKR99348.1 MAG: 30S ribosomal protein S14 type Z [Candidatus Uhrbacteria bacterium GW2011_GWC1_41_2
MATQNQIVKSNRKPKFMSRHVNRCWKCGRNRAYMRDFGLCRICFRELANRGELPGIKKASW